MTTVEKFSWSRSISRTLGFSTTRGTNHGSSSSWSQQGGSSSSNSGSSTSESDSESDSETKDVVQRPLILPDELMVMRRDEALVLVENLNPIKAFKIKWFEHPRFREFGINLEKRYGQK